MNNPEINRQLQRLNDLIKKTEELHSVSIEIQSHWAKYLCVYAAGFIENAVKEIFTDYVKKTASTPVGNYAGSVLQKIQNPKMNIIIQTASSFKKSWGENIKAFAEEDGRGDAVDSIMQNRHQIAHGKDSGITVARLSRYIDKTLELLEYIEIQCST